MTDAPERIALVNRNGSWELPLMFDYPGSVKHGMAYVRADIADEMLLALKGALYLLGDVTQTCDEGDGSWYVFGDDNPSLIPIRNAIAKAEGKGE